MKIIEIKFGGSNKSPYICNVLIVKQFKKTKIMKNLFKIICAVLVVVAFTSCNKEKIEPNLNNNSVVVVPTMSEAKSVSTMQRVDVMLFVSDTTNIGHTSLNILTNSSNETLVNLTFTDTLFTGEDMFCATVTRYFSNEFIANNNNIVVFESNIENARDTRMIIELNGNMAFYENDVTSMFWVEKANTVKGYLWFVNEDVNSDNNNYQPARHNIVRN